MNDITISYLICWTPGRARKSASKLASQPMMSPGRKESSRDNQISLMGLSVTPAALLSYDARRGD